LKIFSPRRQPTDPGSGSAGAMVPCAASRGPQSPSGRTLGPLRGASRTAPSAPARPGRRRSAQAPPTDGVALAADRRRAAPRPPRARAPPRRTARRQAALAHAAATKRTPWRRRPRRRLGPGLRRRLGRRRGCRPGLRTLFGGHEAPRRNPRRSLGVETPPLGATPRAACQARQIFGDRTHSPRLPDSPSLHARGAP